jgi:YfiH family protein
MVKASFSSSHVIAYTAGKNRQAPVEEALHPQATMRQTHSNKVSILDTAASQVIDDCDAIITQLPNLELLVNHADCLPILLNHSSGVIAAIHAGRQGTELKIVQHVLYQLQSTYQVKDELEIWLGPAICVECYQIDREHDTHYNLIEQNASQIREVFSADQAKILYSNHCTAHENEHFYSYRREGAGVPMNWSSIRLKSDAVAYEHV